MKTRTIELTIALAIIIASVTTIAVSCCDSTDPPKNPYQLPPYSKYEMVDLFRTNGGLYGKYQCTVIRYQGHEYMIVEQIHARGGLSIIHLESCQCKQDKGE